MKVVCGPFQPALEEAFLARLSELKPGAERRIAVVAPSRRLADRLQRLVAAQTGCLLGVRFHTFFSLASEVVEASGGPERPVVSDPLLHDLMVDQLFKRRGGVRLTRGLGAAFRASIRDLVDAGINTSRAPELGELDAPEATRRRLSLLFTLTSDYQDALAKAGVMSSSGLTIQARRALDKAPELLAGYAEVLYYGFYDLTALQASFLQSVAAARPTTVFYPYAVGHPAFAFAKPFVEEFLHAGGKAPEYLPPAAGGALGPAWEALFAPGKRAQAAPGAVRFVSASGRRDEAWAAAQEVRRLRDEEGLAFDDIAVAARTLEPYRAALSEALSAHGIPFSLEDAGPLLAWPAARLCLLLATLHQRDYPAEAVLELAESPYFRGPGRPSDWRALLEHSGLCAGWLQWEGKVAPWTEKSYPLGRPKEDGTPAPSVSPESTKALWDWVSGLRKRLSSKSGGWAERAKDLSALLAENLSAPKGDPGAPALMAALEAASKLVAYDGLLEPPGAGAFAEAYEESLRRTSLERPRPARGVRVVDAMAARGDSFEALVVVGLEEGLFPRAAREDPLLPDAARLVLKTQLGHWLHGKLEEGYEEERLLFALLTGSARKRLCLVWSRADEAGRPRVPSPYLRDLAEALGTPLEGATVLRVPRPLARRLATAPRERVAPRQALFLMNGAEKGLDGFLGVLGLDAGLYRQGREALAPLSSFGKAGPHDGLIGKTMAAARLLKSGLSPSALDTLAACPFQFFAAKLLRLPEAEEPGGRGEMPATELGTLYHSVLQRFHSGGEQKNWRGALIKAAEGVFAPELWRPLGLYPVLWEAVRQRAFARLERLVELDLARLEAEGLKPAHFEVALENQLGELSLRGRLDRVDLSADGRRARVVDYKTRFGPGRQPREVLRLSSTQPAVYLELLLGAGWYKGGAEGVAGSEFLNVEDDEQATGKAWRQALEGDDWRTARAGLAGALEALRGLLAEGQFPIDPDEGEGKKCSFCSYAALCRKAHYPARHRAENSEARAILDGTRTAGAAAQ